MVQAHRSIRTAIGIVALSLCAGLSAPGSGFAGTPPGYGPPKAMIESPKSGGVYRVGADVPTAFSCEDVSPGYGILMCMDSNGYDDPEGFLPTNELGPHTYTVTATTEDYRTGSTSISYDVIKARPDLTANGATSAPMVGRPITVGSELTDGYEPEGDIVFRAYGPDTSGCAGDPVFVARVPVDESGSSRSPGFAAPAPGQYRWQAEYLGDSLNQDTLSKCGVRGSISSVARLGRPQNCPPAHSSVALAPLKPARKHPARGLAPGLRARIRVDGDYVVAIRPSMAFRLRGERRIAGFTSRIVHVDGSRRLRFTVPARVRRALARKTGHVLGHPVTLRIDTYLWPRGANAACARNGGRDRMRTRITGVQHALPVANLTGWKSEADEHL